MHTVTYQHSIIYFFHRLLPHLHIFVLTMSHIRRFYSPILYTVLFDSHRSSLIRLITRNSNSFSFTFTAITFLPPPPPPPTQTRYSLILIAPSFNSSIDSMSLSSPWIIRAQFLHHRSINQSSINSSLQKSPRNPFQVYPPRTSLNRLTSFAFISPASRLLHDSFSPLFFGHD